MPPGEVIELFPEPTRYKAGNDAEIQANGDGSELISLFGPDDRSQDWDAMTGGEGGFFGENLAEQMSSSQRHTLADKLTEFHRVDLESRKDWDRLTNQAMRLLGIEKCDSSMLPFPGAAAMQHPVIAEACVQFNANAIEEFFPATGPVKGDIAGEANADTTAQCERASEYMNYYLTAVDEGYYADKDQSLFHLPIAGSIFTKAYKDPRDQMPRARYIKADDFVVPYAARDLENCSRYAHQYQMTGSEIRRAQSLGEFIDIKLPRPPLEAKDDGRSKIEDVSDRRTRVLHEDDELYDILEYHVELALPAGIDEMDDGTIDLPYIVLVDATSREILSVRRNWKREDPKRKKRIWFAHYKFLPGLGFYGWGFLHVIGSLADAISGSVRAALDSALMATLQGGFRAKDGVKGAGSIAIEPGKWKDIDASSEELAKTFYTPPFKEPSQMLVNLLQALVADARRFTSLTEVLVGQADNKAPVGTTIALIEQSMKLFTAIHKRIFAAARQEFRMLAELLHDFGPDREYPYYLSGEQRSAFQEDFDPETIDFLPVADPNIISDVQRIALAQAVLELVSANPTLYGPEQQVEAHRRFLKALKVPEWEKLAPTLPKPSYLDPVGENAMMMVGRPVRAFPGQHHAAHTQIHMHQVQVAENTLPPDQFQQVYAVLMSHVREHQALEQIEMVSQTMQQQIGAPLPPTDIYGPNEDQPPELERAISIIAAQSLPPVPAPLPGSVGEAQQAPPQKDPAADAQAKAQALEIETQARIERDTNAFAAEQQRKKAEAAMTMRFKEQEHDQQMRHEDERVAADVIRLDAKARAERQMLQQQSRLKLAHERVAGASKLAQAVRTEREKEKVRKSAKKKPAAKKAA